MNKLSLNFIGILLHLHYYNVSSLIYMSTSKLLKNLQHEKSVIGSIQEYVDKETSRLSEIQRLVERFLRRVVEICGLTGSCVRLCIIIHSYELLAQPTRQCRLVVVRVNLTHL